MVDTLKPSALFGRPGQTSRVRLGLGGLFLLFLCAAGFPASAQPFGDDGVVKFGFRTDAGPFSFCPEPGACTDDAPCAVRTDACPGQWIEGYSVRLCKRVADHLRNTYGETGRLRQIEFLPVTSDDRFEDLKNGNIHILCGATTVTLDRLSAYRSSLYTFLSGTSVIYPKGQAVKSAADLANRKVGALKNTTTITFLENQRKTSKTSFEIVPLDSHKNAPEKLLAKSPVPEAIDVYFGDREILLWILKGNSELQAGHEVSSIYYSLDPYALFIREENKDLQNEVNAVLADLFAEENWTVLEKIFQESFDTKEMSDLVETLFRIQRIRPE